MAKDVNRAVRTDRVARSVGQVAMAHIAIFGGLSHLFWARGDFAAQVPKWMPGDVETLELIAGLLQIVVGFALLSSVVWQRYRPAVGWICALVILLLFPGHVTQFFERTDSFFITGDIARTVRLVLQPLFIVLVLWSTGAWRELRRAIRSKRGRDRGGAPLGQDPLARLGSDSGSGRGGRGRSGRN